MGREDARLLSCQRLEGGAVQENWRLVVAAGLEEQAQRENFVLRTDAQTALPDSRPKSEEFALLKTAWNAGVLVPEPLWLCTDPGVIGAPFLITREVTGIARGRAITAMNQGEDGNPSLLAVLANELAKIHSIKSLPRDLAFLHRPASPASVAAIGHWREELADLPGDWPALEWSLRWCQNHLPAAPTVSCLVHGDFRTGNYLVDPETGHLTAVLDWEFASWGDPMSDLGWFCAACWRFDRPDLEAGGIGRRDALYAAYEAASGHRPDPAAVYFWEVLAHIRWAIIAVQQGCRFFEGGEDSLDLALTGRMRPTQVQERLLEMTAPDQWLQRGQAAANANSPLPGRRKVEVMTDPATTRRILETAATLFREELQPTLPPVQQENARMLQDALACVLKDLEPMASAAREESMARDHELGEQIRSGRQDGEKAMHLALLQAISRDVSG